MDYSFSFNLSNEAAIMSGVVICVIAICASWVARKMFV